MADAGGMSADVLFDAGLERFGAGDYDAAVEAMREALVLEPRHMEAAHGLIRALDRAGRDDEAVAAAEALIAKEPEDVLARTSLSMIYQRVGRVEDAEKVALEAKLLGWKRQLRDGADAVTFGGDAGE